VELVVVLAFFAAILASWWVVFEKAGEPGWAAVIPIYNLVVELRICGKPEWWVILLFIPLVNIVIGLIMVLELARVFDKGGGFTLGLIFLPFIFLPLLAFGDARYIGPDGRRRRLEGMQNPFAPDDHEDQWERRQA
jgi:hypothetical protein